MVQVHATLAVIALVTGPVIFLRRKGDRLHRMMGYIFVTAMVLLNVSALTIYEISGRPTVFHLLALVNLTTVGFGLARVRQGKIAAHLNLMGWAYAGLIMALASRLSPLLPLPFWPASLLLIAIVWAATYLILDWDPASGGRNGETPHR